MSTFLQMQSRIADDLDRTDLNTQIKLAINRAIKHYAKEPFWFKETSGSFSAVVNQEEYVYGTGGVPSDVEMIDIMEVVYGGTKSPVVEITPFELEAKQSQLSYGQPDEFAQYQNRFKLFPIPNQSGTTILLKYTKSYTDLSADADTNDWLTYAEDLIESRAKWWLNMRVIKDIPAANDDATCEVMALEALQVINNHKTGGGEVIPTSF
jgi:hypothetical protein